MAAQSISLDVSSADPLASLRRAGGGGSWARRAAVLAGLAGVVALVAVAAPRVGQTFGDALMRALHADPRWVVAGIAFELLSFAGYVTLFWHVAGRSSSGRIGARAAWQVSLASTAATRLLPTAGAGGAALTFWLLRRAGHSSGAATRTLLTFLVVLYSVFLGALAVAGVLLATGVAGSGGGSASVSGSLSAVPAVGASLAIVVALLLALRAARRSSDGVGRIGAAAHALGASVREALTVVRRPHVRLLGAPAWWGFDMLVLWATFNAFGTPPSPVVLVLAYFLGQVANTVPLPGAASGGMVGAFLAVGMPAEVALPAVLAYRAIAIWTPVPFGAVALGGLRRTVARWAVEDDDTASVKDTDGAMAPAAPASRSGRVLPGLVPAAPAPAGVAVLPARVPACAGRRRAPSLQRRLPVTAFDPRLRAPPARAAPPRSFVRITHRSARPSQHHRAVFPA